MGGTFRVVRHWGMCPEQGPGVDGRRWDPRTELRRTCFEPDGLWLNRNFADMRRDTRRGVVGDGYPEEETGFVRRDAHQ